MIVVSLVGDALCFELCPGNARAKGNVSAGDFFDVLRSLVVCLRTWLCCVSAGCGGGACEVALVVWSRFRWRGCRSLGVVRGACYFCRLGVFLIGGSETLRVFVSAFHRRRRWYQDVVALRAYRLCRHNDFSAYVHLVLLSLFRLCFLPSIS